MSRGEKSEMDRVVQEERWRRRRRRRRREGI